MIDPTPDEAFDRSANYSWCGQPIHWARRHRWLWLIVARCARQAQELDELLAMWIGQLDMDELKLAERKWREDPSRFLDEFMEFASQFDEDGQETLEAARTYRQIEDDRKASTEAAPPGGAGSDSDEFDGSPKKSEPALATSTT